MLKHPMPRVVMNLVVVIGIVICIGGIADAKTVKLADHVKIGFSGINVFELKVDSEATPPNAKLTGTGPLKGYLAARSQYVPITIGDGAIEITISYEMSEQGEDCWTILVAKGEVTVDGQKIDVGQNYRFCVEPKQVPPAPSADFPHGKKASNPKPKP